MNTATADKNVSTMDDFKHMEKKTFLPTVVVSGGKAGPFVSNWLLKIVELREREGQRVDSGRSLKGHL